MRHALVIFAVLSFAAPALAEDAPPKTLVMPTKLMNQIYQYILTRPYAEVASLAADLQACNLAQVADPKDGSYSTAAQTACPDVASVVNHSAAPAKR